MDQKQIDLKRISALVVLAMLFVCLAGGVVGYITDAEPDHAILTRSTVPYVFTTVFCGVVLLCMTFAGWLRSNRKLEKVAKVAGMLTVGTATIVAVGFVIMLFITLFILGSLGT